MFDRHGLIWSRSERRRQRQSTHDVRSDKSDKSENVKMEPEVAQLMAALESNRAGDSNEAKAKLAELFANVKDGWPVVGFVNYYLSTGSVRIAEALAKAPPPHDKILCDRIADGLRGNWRRDALALLGHVVRRQPSWLHKIVGFPVFRELLNVLKTERETVPLMSGLLLLITLLPMVPTLLGPHLQEIFQVFARLAAWQRCRTGDAQKEHLQLALYGLFENLYGMFPCNFVDFLQKEYGKRENSEVFVHTLKPMLETVRMHPLLITASKNTETDGARWKKMEHHDVLVECRRFSSERAVDEERRFRSRCGTDASSLAASDARLRPSESANSTPNLTNSAGLSNKPPEPGGDGWFSLYEACGVSTAPSAPQTPLPAHQDAPPTPGAQMPLRPKRQDGGSPPETAVEATPENTPIKDGKQRFNFPNDSPAVRALGSRLVQPQGLHHRSSSSPSCSQPTSPLKKEPSPFARMCSTEGDGKDAYYAQTRINRILQDRTSQQITESFSSLHSLQKRGSGSPLKKITVKDCGNVGGFIPSVPNSPVPLGAAAPVSGSTEWPLAKPKPQKDGFPFDMSALILNTVENVNREDKEIIEINKRGEAIRSASASRDSAACSADPESKPTSAPRHALDDDNDEEADERWTEDETTCGEDPYCTEKKHGLHMPPSQTIFFYYQRAARSRYFSQCVTDSSGGSATRTGADLKSEPSKSKSIRKSSSCPNIKYGSEDCRYRLNDAKDKNAAMSYQNGTSESFGLMKSSQTVETQTIEVWPLEYEHLFNDILQNAYDQNPKNGSASLNEDDYFHINKYAEILSQSKGFASSEENRSPKEEINFLRQQLELMHLELLYERHRREVHAVRNRRLLGRSRKNREAEELIVALKQQLSLVHVENDDLRQQVYKQKQSIQNLELKHQESNKYWQHQMCLRESEIQTERLEKERLSAVLLEQQAISNDSSADIQHLRANLFDVTQELKRAIRKSEMGDRQIECIKRMQRELIMCGERDNKYKEVLNFLPAKIELVVSKQTQQYKEQLSNLQTLLQNQTIKMEQLQIQESELESTLATKDSIIKELKKQLQVVKEENSERLKAVEEKYQTIKRTNQRLEAYCLELLQRVPQSPQTISRDLTSGFSPQSSPLSASLASSEGHGPFEIRNLQVYVNTPHETIEESNNVNNSTFEDNSH